MSHDRPLTDTQPMYSPDNPPLARRPMMFWVLAVLAVAGLVGGVICIFSAAPPKFAPDGTPWNLQLVFFGAASILGGLFCAVVAKIMALLQDISDGVNGRPS